MLVLELLIKPKLNRKLKIAQSSGELEQSLNNDQRNGLQFFLHKIYGDEKYTFDDGKPVSSYKISEIRYAFQMIEKFSNNLPSFYDEAAHYKHGDFDKIEASVIQRLSDGNIHAPRILTYLVKVLKVYHTGFADLSDPCTPFVFRSQ